MKTEEITDVSRLVQLLFGVDLNNIPNNGSIVWIKSIAADLNSPARPDPHDLNASYPTRIDNAINNATFVFSAIPLEQLARPHMQLLGDLGAEGDEAVFGDGIIIETCSLTGLEYIDILGPTYISFENETDETLLRDLLTEFKQTGKLSNCFTYPGTIFDLAGFAPELFPLERKIIDETGISPWPSSPIIEKIRNQDPELSRYFAGAIIMARKIGDTDAKFTFSIPTNQQHPDAKNVVLAHSDTEYRCMNIHNGRMFSLGYDMYRATLSVINPEQFETLPGGHLSTEALNQALELFHGKVIA